MYFGMQIKMVDVQTVVLDEVDVMFLDETFDLTAIGTSAPAGTQFVFVTATLPVAVADQVRMGGLQHHTLRSCDGLRV